MADKAKAAEYKDKGNKALAAKNFDEAIAMYSEVSPVSVQRTRVRNPCTRLLLQVTSPSCTVVA